MVEERPHAYHIFWLDDDGRYLDTQPPDADDQSDAIIKASGKVESAPIELWDRDRLLVRLDPELLKGD